MHEPKITFDGETDPLCFPHPLYSYDGFDEDFLRVAEADKESIRHLTLFFWTLRTMFHPHPSLPPEQYAKRCGVKIHKTFLGLRKE
jgi:hypothetical protein